MANMTQPLPLIEYSQRGELIINEEAVNVVENIRSPIKVVGISGRYREGKSYLANFLAGITTESKKFPLGATVESETKGIWFYCTKHPRSRDTTIIILDSEGLDDPKKTDAKTDLMLLTLILLQSTVFILNGVGKINDADIKLLQYVAEVSEKFVKADSSRDCGPENLKSYYPAFYLVLRDCYLEPVVDQQEVSGNEYLEQCLELKSGISKTVTEYNQPRLTIKNCFERRKCFFMHRPVDQECDLRNLGSIPTDKLNEDFRREIEDLQANVFAEEKSFNVDGLMLDGRGWLSLLRKTLDVLNSGGVPVLRHACEAVIKEENKNTLLRAGRIYEEKMDEQLDTVMETDDLTTCHNCCEENALQYFRENAKGNKTDLVTMEMNLKDRIRRKYDEYYNTNMHKSLKSCRSLLQNLYKTVMERIKDGMYTMPGGFNGYQEDQVEVIQLYNNEPCKGPAAQDVLKNFLEEKKGEGLAIQQAAINLEKKDFDTAKGMEELNISSTLGTSCPIEKSSSEVFEVCNTSYIKAFENYKGEMEKKMQQEKTFETEELENIHQTTKKQHLDMFEKETIHVKGDIREDIRRKLEGFIESMLEDYKRRNTTISETKCFQLLHNLFTEIDKKVKDKHYAIPGGHNTYSSDIEECVILYHHEPYKGPAAEEVFEKYMKDREEESCSILETDKKLTEDDRVHASTLNQDEKRNGFLSYLGFWKE